MQKILFLMLGYPGAGKTTAAKIIHQLTGAEHLWADQVRREIYKSPTYSHEENVHLYSHLNDITDKLLAEGKNVIFDTNFNFYKDRSRLRQIAAKNNAKAVVVWIQAPKNVAKQRATVDAHLHVHTRVLGHMPEEHFERISNNLEPPMNDESHIIIDGTKINGEYLQQKLQAANLI